MKIIIGESAWERLARLAFRGCIGIFYESTLGGMAAYLIFALIAIFTAIGVIATLKFLINKAMNPRRRYRY